MSPSPCRRLASTLLLTVALTAQIEPGWGVVGSAWNTGQPTRQGIWTFDPVHGSFTQVPTPASWAPPGNGGVYSTLVRDSDGAIVAGTISWGTPLEIGVKVGAAPWAIYTLGGSFASPVSDLKWLPDGRVLFCYYNLTNPNYGLSTHGLAILDPSLPPTNAASIQPIPVTGLPTPVNALALDPGGQSVYVGLSGPSHPGNIYQVPLAGGAATLRATQSAGILDLFFDYQGRLIVGTLGQGLLAYDTASWTSTVCATFPYCGGCLDPTTGSLLIAYIDPVTMAGSMAYGTCGQWTPVPGFPGANLAALGLDIRASLIEFDPPPTTHPYTWEVTPNANGAARIGNQGFGLTATSLSPPAMAFLCLGLGRVPPGVVAPAVHVLLDSTQPSSWFFYPAAPPTITEAFRIPTGIGPFDFYAQVFAAQAGVWRGSSGLRIHVF